MYTMWTRHLSDPKEKEVFERKVQGSKEVLERLMTLLNEQERDLNQTETNLKIYDLPNWDYRQAHNNGFRQCLNIQKKLINLDQQKDTTTT